ncbi:hypothetical protein [Kribbella sindirgiensis]|nr:hypothetical protein [Kribbella sindirgiensis]
MIQGDAAELPFADGVFATVAVLWLSTDVDDFGRQVAYCIQAGWS